MRAAPYPLAAVRSLREAARREAEAALVAAQGAVKAAEQALAAARSACDDVMARRLQAVAPGPTSEASQSGLWLARSGAFAARLQREGRLLAEQLRAAQATLAERARALRLAELSWQQAYAEHEVLERHHARFLQAQRKAREKAEEDEAEDNALARYVLARRR